MYIHNDWKCTLSMFARILLSTLCIRFRKLSSWHRLKIRNTYRFSSMVHHNSDGSIEMSLNRLKWLLNAVHHFDFWHSYSISCIFIPSDFVVNFPFRSSFFFLFTIHIFFIFIFEYGSIMSVGFPKWIFEFRCSVDWRLSEWMIFDLLNVCHSEFGLW